MRLSHSITILTLILMSLVLAACGGDSSSQQPVALNTPNGTTNTGSSNPAPVGNGEGLVARVNGEGITVQTFNRELERARRASAAADANALSRQVLETLIEQVVINQSAASMNIVVTDEEVETEIQSYIETVGGDAAWQQWLTDNAYTAEEFRAVTRSSIVTQRVITEVTLVLDGPILHVHARHILVRTEPEAHTVMERIRNGEDFADVAADRSLDVTTRERGGDLGWFTADGLLEPTLAQQAFALQPGAIAGPVPTRLGYHVLQTLEFEERVVDPEVRVTLQQTYFQNWLQRQIDAAEIERFI